MIKGVKISKEDFNEVNMKIEEYLKEISDKYNVVFKYTLKDAFESILACIVITDSKDNNVFIYDGDNYIYKQMDINKLISILNSYSSKLDSLKDTELPNTNIFDGYINVFDFKADNKWQNYIFYNLDYYTDEQIDNNKFLSTFAEFLIAVCDLFKQYGIYEYFKLVLDDEFEE